LAYNGSAGFGKGVKVMDNDRFQELVLEHFDKIYMRLDVLERYQLKLDNLIENEVLVMNPTPKGGGL
jgi:hypothetical protein